jgi:hypothetical protein
MKIANVSLNFYGQNSIEASKATGRSVRRRAIDIAGFTEVRSKEMREGLIEGLGPNYDTAEINYESPQTFNKNKWKLETHRVVKATEGEAHVTPDLYLVIATYRNIKKPRKVIKVISTHMVPLSDNGHKRPDYVHRRAMWERHWDILKAQVIKANGRGITVFVILDSNDHYDNRRVIKQIHNSAKWVIRKGILWVFVVEGDTKVRRFGLTKEFSSGSDHKAYERNVFLS